MRLFWRGVWAKYFLPLHWQEMRQLHDQCGQGLFYTDELKHDFFTDVEDDDV